MFVFFLLIIPQCLETLEGSYPAYFVVLVAHALFHDAILTKWRSRPRPSPGLNFHGVKGQRNIFTSAGRGPGNEATPQALLNTMVDCSGIYFALNSGKEHRELTSLIILIEFIRSDGQGQTCILRTS